MRLTRAELAASAGLDADTLDALETFGLLHADATGHFGDAALTVAHTAAELAAYGLEPRHLRPFRTAADREIGLVQQVVTPHRSTAGKGFARWRRERSDRRRAAPVHRLAHRPREGRAAARLNRVKVGR